MWGCLEMHGCKCDLVSSSSCRCALESLKYLFFGCIRLSKEKKRIWKLEWMIGGKKCVPNATECAATQATTRRSILLLEGCISSAGRRPERQPLKYKKNKFGGCLTA